MEKFEEIIALIEACEEDVDKFYVKVIKLLQLEFVKQCKMLKI